MRLAEFLEQHREKTFRICGGRFGSGHCTNREGVYNALTVAVDAEVVETNPKEVRFALPDGRIERRWSIQIVQ